MVARRGVLAVALAVSAFAVRDVSASPITWQAAGVIDTVSDALGVLGPITPGTAWALSVTFDSETPGTAVSCGAPAFRYAGAITSSSFHLGGFSYTNGGGDIFTNYALPIGACGSPLGQLGLVQFQMIKGWTGSTGAPDLNQQLGLFLASYRDTNAHDGSLPIAPSFEPNQSPFAGLEWDGTLGGGRWAQFTSTFHPSLAPVPEPATILLVGVGAAWVGRRARSRRSS